MCNRCVRTAIGGLVAMLAMSLLAAVALAVSPSELLEKAIYTEETVGDLEGAIKLYEKVIAEGEAAEQAAAKAQYRLAHCYLKQGKQEKATAAFKKLIEEYPTEKELVAKAEKYLPTKLELLPEPWVDGERMQMNMTLPTGLPIGTMIYMIDSAKHDGQDVWQCSTLGLVTANNASSYSMVLCDKESFAPIKSHWMHTMIGEADAVYKDNAVEIKVVGKEEPIKIEFKPPVFDNEQAAELFRRLPLEVGYKTTIPIVTSLGGNKIELPASVSAKETITVPAGKFECYKLDLGLLNQTFWISTDEHRYLVRFAAGGVTADLAKVDQAKPGEATQVSGKGYSLTLPAGWVAYAPEVPNKKKEETEVILLDPRAQARTGLEIAPIQSLKEEQQESPKAWVDSVIEKFKKTYSDFSIREGSLREFEIGGQPAVVFAADFTESKKMTMAGAAVFGKTSAASLRMTTEAEKIDGLQKDFDNIVESLKLE